MAHNVIVLQNGNMLCLEIKDPSYGKGSDNTAVFSQDLIAFSSHSLKVQSRKNKMEALGDAYDSLG